MPYLRCVARLKSFFRKGQLEVGCDEAGRGCLAGPVVASAVILPKRWNHPLLNDSKKLTENQRDKVREAILNDVEHHTVGVCSHQEIDEINILNASFLAMHRALDGLSVAPDCILVDGNRFTPYHSINHFCIIQGDGIYRSIAAASILAKTHRDALMKELHKEHPEYGWDRNKGYPTKSHRQAIAEIGTSPHHRMSFRLLPKQLGKVL
ncbi:MAG: ribonuclease HII [Cryomorphaceae bacterium]|jgi:ribonuclease HII